MNIPPITESLGRYWEQPDRSGILLDATHAVMTRATLFGLAEYSCSLPSGVYAGKMWRRAVAGGWRLMWYGEHTDPEKCSLHEREVLIVS